MAKPQRRVVRARIVPPAPNAPAPPSGDRCACCGSKHDSQERIWVRKTEAGHYEYYCLKCAMTANLTLRSHRLKAWQKFWKREAGLDA